MDGVEEREEKSFREREWKGLGFWEKRRLRRRTEVAILARGRE